MVTIHARNQLDDVAKSVADLIEKLGFEWKLDVEYPVPGVEKETQIRSEDHRGPRQQVTQYAACMARGDKFAPIVVSKDGFIIDGNTRARAAAKNRYPTIQAFILADDWEGSSDGVRQRMHVLGASFNLKNGRGIDRLEIARAVKEIGKNSSYDATRIAALMGVTASTVSSILAEQRARERAEKLGTHVNGSVPATQLKTLGDAGTKLNDAPFQAVLGLVQDAGLSVRETRELIKVAASAGSDDAALALIEKDRQSRREQIAEFRAAGKAKPPVAAQLRQRLGFVLAHEGNPAALVEHNPTLTAEHSSVVRRAIAILTSALEAQEKVS